MVQNFGKCNVISQIFGPKARRIFSCSNIMIGKDYCMIKLV